MFIKHVERIHPQDRNDADEPSYSQDAEERSLLTFWYLQAPNASDWNNSYHKVCEDVDRRICVPQPVGLLAQVQQRRYAVVVISDLGMHVLKHMRGDLTQLYLRS